MICSKPCERKREREGERNVKVQVLDFWLLAFGRSFCGFCFWGRKKEFLFKILLCFVFGSFFFVLFWVVVFVCFDFVRSFFCVTFFCCFCFWEKWCFVCWGSTSVGFFEVLQNPEELWACNKQVRSEGGYSLSLCDLCENVAVSVCMCAVSVHLQEETRFLFLKNVWKRKEVPHYCVPTLCCKSTTGDRESRKQCGKEYCNRDAHLSSKVPNTM